MSLSIIEKDKIYDYISINKEKFIYKKKEVDSIYTLNILINDFNYDIKFNTINECFNFLTEHWDKKCKNNNCKNNNEDLVRDQPDEKKIIKNLRQFKNEDKKYKKNRL